jgi:ABC-2 type transport system permease protein
VLSLLLSSPVIIGSVLLELKWPKLLWDNPQKAMKQNINAVVPTLFAMFLIPALLFLAYYILRTQILTYIVILLLNIIISAALYIIVISYAKTRFYEIEI